MSEIPVLPPPLSRRSTARKSIVPAIQREDAPVRAHSGMISVPSARISQVAQPTRSASDARMQRSLTSSSVPRPIGLEPAAPTSDDSISVFSAFLSSSSNDASTPVLSFTSSQQGAIFANADDDKDNEEDVEWQWGSASPHVSSSFFASSHHQDPNQRHHNNNQSQNTLSTSPQQNQQNVLVDNLDAAFAEAFGTSTASASSSSGSKRKGHSRGLSGVFVSAAPVTPSAPLSTSPSSSDASVPHISVPAAEAEEEDAHNKRGSRGKRASLSPRNLLAMKAGMSKKLEQREKVVRELLSSEKVYVNSLKKLIDLFYKPLTGRDGNSLGRKSTAPPLTKAEADLLFGQVEVIMLYNARLLEDLSERLCAPDYNAETCKISDIFGKMSSFFQVYVGYSENYAKAMKMYEVIMMRPGKTKKMVKSAEKEAGNIMEAFLILPVQRIPRYILLLKEIIKFTEVDHPDYKDLCETVESIKSLCSAINEAPRKLQETNAMLNVYKVVIPTLPDLLSPSRFFVLQTRAWLMNAEGVIKSRVLFLFNDAMLITRPDGGRQYLRFRISLPNVEVHDTPPRAIDGKEAYIITLEAKAKSIVLVFRDLEGKTEVMEGIAKHNPTIFAGRPGFVPLADRENATDGQQQQQQSQQQAGPPPIQPLSRMSVSSGSIGQVDPTRRASMVAETIKHDDEIKRSGSFTRKSSVQPAPPMSEPESAGRLSGLLSRKKTAGSVIAPSSAAAPEQKKVTSKSLISRKSVRPTAGPEEIEIVRSDADSTPQVAVKSSEESGKAKKISAIQKSIAQKVEEQRDLHKLLAFYRKCNDEEGLAEATRNIAKSDAEIAALKKELQDVLDSKVQPQEQQEGAAAFHTATDSSATDGAVSTVKKRAHMRQRSLSTSSLPKLGRESQNKDAQPAATTVAETAAAVESPPKAVVSTPAAKPTEPQIGSVGTALYNFDGANSGELTFKAGCKVTLASTQGGDWFLGVLPDGQKGWFPKGYVSF